MKILITGATGFIGKRLGLLLYQAGHEITVVTRQRKTALEILPFPAKIIECDLQTTALAEKDFAQIDAVINLVGESIDGRWTKEKKAEILNSRLLSAKNLLAHCPKTMKTLVTTSAQGIYGDRGDEKLSESAQSGAGFLAEVCKAWEAPFLQFQSESQTRVVILRLGMVLSQRGGALAKLIALFQKNLGAALGNGQQWVSYISLEDVCQVYLQAVTDERYEGFINAVAPVPVKNQELTEKICHYLNCLQLPKVPKLVLKTMLGEMSHLVLNSAYVEPRKLKSLGFSYKYADLEAILASELAEFKNGQRFLYSEQYLDYDIKKVFDFFAEAKNLEAITPNTLRFQIDKMSTEKIELHTLIDYKLKIHGVPARWQSLIEVWNPPYQFVDTQLKGPYKHWHHTHTFVKLGSGTLIIDEVRFKVPMGALGQMVAGTFVESDVTKIFQHRRQVIANQSF